MKEQEEEKDWNEKEDEIRAVAFEEYKLKTEEIKREEREILDTQSQPLRWEKDIFKITSIYWQKLLEQKDSKFNFDYNLLFRHYLNENVVPFITEGILEVCRELPEDPVDYLVRIWKYKSIISKTYFLL